MISPRAPLGDRVADPYNVKSRAPEMATAYA
jgi:hypothetical protein